MKYTRHYDDRAHTREQQDAMALADVREYCTPKQWDALQQAVGQVQCGAMTVSQLNFCFAIAGIAGRPFHAFCREYCLEQYREWMAQADDSGPGIKTDEQGFRVKEPVS